MRPLTSSSTGARLLMLGSAVGAMGALRVASQVAAMRRSGRTWRPLDHRDVLPGDEPVLRLVVLGDSAAAGHGLTEPTQALPHQVATRLVERTGRAVQVEAFARSGADTAEVADHQIPEITAAEVVVVGVGVNDALSPANRVGDVHDDTVRLLAAVRARAPEADVVMLTCPDLGTAPGLPRPLAPAVRWRCRTVAFAQMRAAAEAGVPVVATAGPLPSEVFGDDGFHPGPGAVERLAERTVEVLHGAVEATDNEGS